MNSFQLATSHALKKRVFVFAYDASEHKCTWPVSVRTLHNYMMWHLVKTLSSLLSKPFKDAGNEFKKALTGAC